MSYCMEQCLGGTKKLSESKYESSYVSLRNVKLLFYIFFLVEWKFDLIFHLHLNKVLE